MQTYEPIIIAGITCYPWAQCPTRIMKSAKVAQSYDEIIKDQTRVLIIENDRLCQFMRKVGPKEAVRAAAKSKLGVLNMTILWHHCFGDLPFPQKTFLTLRELHEKTKTPYRVRSTLP
jgi:hypothetical protein